VAAALHASPAARGVFLVAPGYTGAIGDLGAIASLAHDHGMPLLVDQAWGAHLGFHPALPPHALAAGADALVTSTHKLLTAFTQASVVLARGGLLDLDRLDGAFELLHTTSPSAAILASTDRARALVATQGPRLLERTVELVAGARRRLARVPGLRVVKADDPTKLVLALAGTGADGFAVEADLARAGVRLEMADRDTLVPIVSMADTSATVDTLVAALERSLAARRGSPRRPTASTAWRHQPTTVLAPREAFFAPRERVPAGRAAGRVAAETAAPYPPGIPVLAPGELVEAEALAALRAEAAAGSRVAYCSDPTLETLLVVARSACEAGLAGAEASG
jgi:lysine decarboxylase